MAGKLLTNFEHLKGVGTFLLILHKKQLTYKISKERRISIVSVVGLDNLSSNLWIVILLLITKLIFKYRSRYQCIARSYRKNIFSDKENF